MVGESNQNVYIDSDRRFEIRRIRDIRVRDIESQLYVTHFFAVGNKDDDLERKVVLTQDAQRFAEQMGIQLYETSAKENKNVEEVRYFVIVIGSLSLIRSRMGIFDSPFITMVSKIHDFNLYHSLVNCSFSVCLYIEVGSKNSLWVN